MNLDKIKILLGFALICLLWGSTWMVIRIGLDSLTPIISAGFRFTLAAIVLFLIIKIRKTEIQKDKTSVILYLILGIFSFVIPFGLVYWGEDHIPSSLASVLFGAYPFFVAVFSKFAFPDEKISINKILGIVIGFLGIIIIFSDDFSTGFSFNLLGMFAVVLSAMLQAGTAVVIKKHGGYLNPLTMNFYPILIAGISFLIFGYSIEDSSKLIFDEKAYFSVAYLALFGTIATFTTYYWLLQRMNVVILSLSAFITPIVAVILGWSILSESFSIIDISGTIMVLIGILFANFKGVKNLISGKIKANKNSAYVKT